MSKTQAIATMLLWAFVVCAYGQVSNGSFEAGVTGNCPDGWTCDGNVSVFDYEGNHMLRLDEPAGGAVSRAYQEFAAPTPVGGTVRVSFRYALVSLRQPGAIPATVPPDGFAVFLVDSVEGTRIGLEPNSPPTTNPEFWACAYFGEDSDGTQRFGDPPVTLTGPDANDLYTVEFEVSGLVGGEYLRVEFGLASTANGRNTFVVIDDVTAGGSMLTITCPGNTTVDYDQSLDPNDTGWADAATTCPGGAVTVGYVDAPPDPNSYAAAVAALAPIHYWRLHNTPSDTAGAVLDYGLPVEGRVHGTHHDPNHCHLVSSEGITGCDDPALSLDPNQQAYVTVPHNATMDPNNGSISLWFKAASVAAEAGLFSKDEDQTDVPGHVSINIDPNDPNRPPGTARIRARLQYQQNQSVILYSDNVVTADTWYHVTLTFGTGGMKLYLDGVLVRENLAYHGGMGGNNEILFIGAGAWLYPSVLKHFYGTVDEVMMFDYELTQEQVTRLHTASGCTFGIARTWTADDDCSNEESCTQTITVQLPEP